jgi:hypothetical protein
VITYPSAWFLAAVMVVLGVSVFARGLGARTIGQHRAGHGAAPYTAPAGVVRQGFGWCDLCEQTMPGVITRHGFRCDCGTPAGGVR